MKHRTALAVVRKADNAAMNEPSMEMLVWHWIGGLLLGAYPGPDHVPDNVKDERLRRVVEALIAVRFVDGVWPVDLGRIVDVLCHVDAFHEIGGTPLLLDLMATWDERITCAQILGEREAWVRIALAACRAEIAADDDMFAAVDRRERAREKSNEAIAALGSASEAA